MCFAPNTPASVQKNMVGYVGNVLSGNSQGLTDFRSRFQAQHGGMTAQQLVQRRGSMPVGG